MKVSTQWLRDFIEMKPPLEAIAERLTMAGLEVKKIDPTPDRKDFIWEIEVTTNRPDWLSHFGVAREIAAVENLSLKPPVVEALLNRPVPSGWRIDSKELESCPYYTGVYIEGITQTATPDFIRERLLVCGVRCINLIVDITNYVLLETGQPLHAFDADLIEDQTIVIRKARTGEKFKAINNAEYQLDESDLVIATSKNVHALAGVMGGLLSEVNERTRNVFLESAYFIPRHVRQTSRRHALASESSYRFERKVDPAGVDYARERALTLIKQYGKPRYISAAIKAGQPPKLTRERIHIPVAEFERTLGYPIKSSVIASLLTRLGIDVKIDSASTFNIEAPSYRHDLIKPIDVVEEVARLYGYDQIPESLPNLKPILQFQDGSLAFSDRIKNYFSGIGLFETVTFSLITGIGYSEDAQKGFVKINNRLNPELCVLRPNLLASLLAVVGKNINCGANDIGLFEVAHTYSLKALNSNLVQEDPTIGIILSGQVKAKNWLENGREVSYFDLKGMITDFITRVTGDAPLFSGSTNSLFEALICEQIFSNGAPIGYMGQVNGNWTKLFSIDQTVYYAEIKTSILTKDSKKNRTFVEWSRFPAVERDMSFVVSETIKAQTIIDDIHALGGAELSRVQVFDYFKGGRIPKGFKSLGFRLIYQSATQTLVSDDVQKKHEAIAAEILKKYQASFQ